MAKVQFGFASANSLTNKQILPLLLTGAMVWSVGAFGHYFISGSSSSFSASAPSVSSSRVEMVAMGGAEVSVPSVAPSVSRPADEVPAERPLSQQVVKQVTDQIAQVTQTAPMQAVAAVGSMAADAMASKPENVDRQVELGEGETFSNMLNDADIPAADVASIVKTINQVYAGRRLQTGQEFTLGFLRRGTDEALQSVVFQPEPTKEVVLERMADGSFSGKINVTPLERQRVASRASIRSTLREAGRREGIPANIMAALIRVYAHSVDFQRDIHPGDRFEVLYDQPTAKDGKPVGDGTIIYAALEVGGKTKPLYRVTFGDGTVDYFDAQGQSIKRALLRTPVDGARVTSGFGMRVHPLLGYSKMHKGIDFGAAPGSPIFAAGSGIIEQVGFNGSYGRYVRIRHNGKTETAYGHMSRFARNLYQGARVNQGDVIGFVGSSGRATGPHLHFEVMVGGDQINPMNVSMPMGRVLEGQALNQFRQGEKRIQQEFMGLLSKGGDSSASITPPVTDAKKPVHTSQAKTTLATKG